MINILVLDDNKEHVKLLKKLEEENSEVGVYSITYCPNYFYDQWMKNSKGKTIMETTNYNYKTNEYEKEKVNMEEKFKDKDSLLNFVIPHTKNKTSFDYIYIAPCSYKLDNRTVSEYDIVESLFFDAEDRLNNISVDNAKFYIDKECNKDLLGLFVFGGAGNHTLKTSFEAFIDYIKKIA